MENKHYSRHWQPGSQFPNFPITAFYTVGAPRVASGKLKRKMSDKSSCSSVPTYNCLLVVQTRIWNLFKEVKLTQTGRGIAINSPKDHWKNLLIKQSHVYWTHCGEGELNVGRVLPRPRGEAPKGYL